MALVIDDDAASIQLLHACLEPFGVRVTSSRSVAEAKQLIESVLPAIVICDLVIPPEDGLVFIRWLRARPPEQGGTIPVIAVTFFYDRFDVRDTRAAGFDMFVRKPIDPMDIVHAVTVLVNRRDRG
jgi:CheY-like chemotaxis protein